MFALSNGWTGGQYSLCRFAFGILLLVHFSNLFPYAAELSSREGMLPDPRLSPLIRAFPNLLAVADSPLAVYIFLGITVLACLSFAAGALDRPSAILIWYVWACLLDRNPLIRNPGIPFVGWLLLLHAFLPAAPYLSIAARGRPDPAGGWRMPPALFGAAWILLSAAYTYSGVVKLTSPSWVGGSALKEILDNPLERPGPLRDFALAMPDSVLQCFTWAGLGLEILFAPLAFLRRVRPYIWSAMILMHFGLLGLIDFADLTFGMLIIHAFTFDPAWVRRAGAVAAVSYDGGCALCHGFVRFVIAEGPETIRFAPLGTQTPGSIVVTLADGRESERSDAVIAVLRSCGGLWRIFAEILAWAPRRLRDAGYDMIAAIRYRVLGRTEDACPLLPPALRSRIQGAAAEE